jgi:hypothetical protein
VKRSAIVVALAAVFVTMVPAVAQASTSERSVRYGPFTIPAATQAGPGMLENKLRFAVQRPCIDCYITSFRPDLVYENGTSATMADGVMLHHAVLTSQFRPDPTCSGTCWG